MLGDVKAVGKLGANHSAVLLEDLANKRLSLFGESSIIEHK
jgi:hypothetical protein